MFRKIKDQINSDSYSKFDLEYFNMKITMLVFRMIAFLVCPLLILGSYFFFKTNFFIYGIIEAASGVIVFAFIFLSKPNYEIKKTILFIALYILSIFILIVVGSSGGGFASVIMSTYLLVLLTKKEKGYFTYVILNIVTFSIISIGLYLNLLDGQMITEYEEAWPFMFVLMLLYTTVIIYSMKSFKLNINESSKKIQQNNQELRNILRSTNDSMIALDNFKHITYYNQVATDFFNLDEMCISKNIIDLIKSDEYPNIDESIIKDKEYRINKYFIRNRVVDIKNKNKNTDGFLIISQDVTEQHNHVNQLKYLIDHDSLTGLYNYQNYIKDYNILLKAENIPLSLIIVDINGLRIINESFGFNAGDNIIKLTSEVLKKVFISKKVYRVGNDEFLVMLEKTNLAKTKKYIDLLKKESLKHSVEGINLSLSYGFYIVNEPNKTLNQVSADLTRNLNQDKILNANSSSYKIINLILNTLYEKNPREMNHSKRVAFYARSLAEALGYSKTNVKKIEIAGLMHDIGKITIDESILNKPSRLTNEEFELIKEHPQKGYNILNSHDEFKEISTFVLQHHERIDGFGYPSQLKGDEIKEESKILSIADAYDAMTGPRTYRNALSVEEATNELIKNKDKQFDSKLVDIFLDQVINHK